MRYQVLFLMFMIIPLVKVMSLEKATTKNLFPVGMDAKSSLLEKEMNAKGDVTLVEAQEKEMNAKGDVTLVEALEKEMNAKEDVTLVETREKEMNAKGDVTLREAQEKKMNTLPIPNLADEMNALDETANSSFLSENLADEMNTTGSSSYLWGVNKHNQIFFRTGISGQWQHVGGLLQKVELSAGSATIWGVTTGWYTHIGNKNKRLRRKIWNGGAIFVRVGIHDPKGWRNVAGVLRDVSVSDDGMHIWGVGRDYEIYYRLGGHHGTWTLTKGTFTQLSVGGIDGKSVWGCDKKSLVWHRAGYKDVNGKLEKWKLIGGSLKQISVSWSGMHIWGVNGQNQVWYRNGVHGSWSRVEGILKWVSVSSDGSQVWGISPNNVPFYRLGTFQTGHWVAANGRLKQIDVNSQAKVSGQKLIHP